MTGAAEPLIHAAVREHAARRPQAPALHHRRATLTYGALDRASDALAAALSAHGAGPGQIVPVMLPPEPHQLLAGLAVLKCGAAYTNVDPEWPAERIEGILRQVAPRVVVTDATGPDSPDGLARTFALMRISAADFASATAAGTAYTAAALPSTTPAAVFFTSGTTGAPKGVVVPHRAVTRMFRSGGLPGFGPGHTTPQLAAPMWDMHALEVWGQLTSGGAVALSGTPPLPGMLRELIRDTSADTMWLTTSLFNLFVDEDPDCFTGLAELIIGGEKLSSAHVRTFLRRHPGITLRNGYGPAENGMLTTTHMIRPADCDVPEGIPVGRPVPGTAVYVLDPDGRPCGPGRLGEICATGSGLAVGYLGQPELTAEQFPTVTIAGEPVRVYRTGDLGAWDDDGTLHFRGRRDRQVKINGVRIELAEIEIAALGVTGVRDCIAVPLTGVEGQVERLALCYLAGPDERGLRAELRRRLPAAFVPAVLRRLDHFPVTANGKVDQAELQSVATGPRQLPVSRVARDTPRVPGGARAGVATAPNASRSHQPRSPQGS